MPMPRWWTQINKRVFNQREIRHGRRPILFHTGRRSGTTHLTPLDAHAVDDGYVFILVYGSESDWVRNVLAEGRARLRIEGRDVELSNPRVIGDDEAWRLLPDSVKRPPRFLRINEYLRMDLADR
ncbi:nitroreductase family deazaflavin-dependent oxidoreductase [Actinobacteria bacterium YIM 96077]|uniref:Nitroreductase family deazaflavin-dependent oxidoreductase n=1 Tax=Phytoactinopolyspora halophila TaxID=1981511 RepID=A0A329QCK9_9ACTN|nr:nitroreductase family deazaflavin-dependent oxidoreductase [Phytoactinopolyspora halophila]AYY15548.1 nitroreductase family deazaflavin-dependent oxidoreductase [Actinobacteria bacterium YIM 96077]RAW09489.1 nitroreductase family deazaflavin-dependent oxidoreductase [Phytoactinopolyspora halophila]